MKLRSQLCGELQVKFRPSRASERRNRLAHGESRGTHSRSIRQAPVGAAENGHVQKRVILAIPKCNVHRIRFRASSNRLKILPETKFSGDAPLDLRCTALPRQGSTD